MRDHGAALANAFDKLPAAEKDKFVSVTGSLIYLSVDRYDVQYVVRLLAQKLNEPTNHDMLRLKHVIKYLLGTADWAWSFIFQKRSEDLQAQSDSDWAADVETRKSVSSGFLRNGAHVWEHWCTGQQLVALSSGEAEFYAAGKAAAANSRDGVVLN